jgi:hypothetical protein
LHSSKIFGNLALFKRSGKPLGKSNFVRPAKRDFGASDSPSRVLPTGELFMNITEHLLTALGEEGAEITQAASKALRFGLDDVYPSTAKNPNGASTTERLVDELNDLMGVIEILQDRKILPITWFSPEKVDAKKVKILKYLQYAKERGTLDGVFKQQ